MSILGLESLFSQKVALLDVIDEEGSSGAEFFKHLVWQGFKWADQGRIGFPGSYEKPGFRFQILPLHKISPISR